MSLFFIILTASFTVSLMAFSGVALFVLKSETMRKFSRYFISFAAGAILGLVFLDILPEIIELETVNIFWWVLAGIVVFFILEKFLLWYHCHGEECPIHKQQSASLILIGDAVHNFIDGIIIVLAFFADISLGILTTIAMIFHEVPQEIGDFSILLYAGMSKAKALIWNFLVALTVVIGAGLTYILSNFFIGLVGLLLAFVSGHFIYISTADLIPELHRESNLKRSFFQIALLCLGIAVMWLARIILPY